MPDVCKDSVLLVEDNPLLSKLFSIYLKKAGFNTIQANDGIDAIVKLRDTVPVVIASDLLLPRMSGIELISVVRRRLPSIPVVVISGKIPDQVPEEAKPDVWLNKGALQPSEFAAAVQDLARRVPERVDLPVVVPVPFRTRVDAFNYVRLTCTDCLRAFRATTAPERSSAERTAICTFCEASIPYVIESTEP